MKFGSALELLTQGVRVQLKIWNQNEFIYLTEGTTVDRNNLRGNCAKFHPKDPVNQTVTISDHIDKHLEDNRILIGWTPTAEEMFSDEWVIYDTLGNPKK